MSISGVVVIGCGARKQPQPAPARKLYTGSLFTLSRQAAEALAPRGGWFILSARYGLVSPDMVLSPYDLRMGGPGSVSAAVLRRQAAKLGIHHTQRLLVYAGSVYVQACKQVWPGAVCPYSVLPKRGLGYQMQFLKAVAATGDPWGGYR